MFKAIFFDMDGTICDTLPLAILSFKKSIEDITHVTLSDKEITDTFGPSEEATIKALIPEHYEEGIKYYWKYYKELHNIAKNLYNGIEDIFKFLKSRGIKIALITGKAKQSCDISLDYYNISSYFDIIKVGNPIDHYKSANIISAMKELNLEPSEVLYVGDTKNDIKSSRDANVKIASALWGSYIDEEGVLQNKPDYYFKTVKSFDSFIKKLF